MLCAPNLRRSATEAGASAAHAESLKVAKYAHLSSVCITLCPLQWKPLVPTYAEATGSFKSLGQRLQRATVTMDPRAGEFLNCSAYLQLPSRREMLYIHLIGSLNSFVPCTGRF